ncbi:MAG TPA: hypothetical protein VGO93_14485 [Candidatus Xenobia bacterium]|jgi:hypothetical protein
MLGTIQGPSVRAFTSRDSLDQTGDPSRLLRYASNIPIVGGIAETVYGIEELKHAQSTNAKVNADVDIAQGATGTVSNAAQAVMYTALFKTVPATLIHVAAPIAGVTGMVGSVVDGARDIYNSAHGGKRSDKVVGLVKIASGGMTGAGAFTGNIPLMVAGSVVYGGAVIYQNRQSIASTWHAAENKIEQVAHQILEVVPPPRLQSS